MTSTVLLHNQHIHNSIIICSTGRSGSTLLSRTLRSLQTCGNPEEYFHYKRVLEGMDLKNNAEEFLGHCNTIFQKGTTANGVFGIKMHWWQMFNFLKIAKQLPEFETFSSREVLETFFPSPKFIYIWRHNQTAQAVSTTIALQTELWENPTNNQQGLFLTPKKAKENPSVQFQPLKIYSWEQRFKDQNARWKAFFEDNNISFHEILTEDFVKNFQESIQETLDFIGISAPPEQIPMQTSKQSSELNRQFIERYEKYPRYLLKLAFKIKKWRSIPV